MNIFKDKSGMPEDAAPRRPEPMFGPAPVKPDVVRSVMTPAEDRQLRMSNYPQYDWMDVEHIPVRHRGHHY